MTAHRNPETATGTGADMSAIFVDAVPAWLRARYAHLLLVSRADQACDADADTLVVCCDWLAWRELAEAGVDAVHWQCFWPQTDFGNLQTDLFLAANDWMYRDSQDITEFGGVSLGRLFVKEAGLAILERARLRQSLETIARAYKPERVTLRAFYPERSMLNDDERFHAVADACSAIGITLSDARVADTRFDEMSPENLTYGIDLTPVDNRLPAVAALFERMAVMAGQVRRAVSGKSGGVLMLTTQLNGRPLLAAHGPKDPLALLIARHYPGKRDLRQFMKDICGGLVPVAMPSAALSEADDKALAVMDADIRAHTRSSRDPQIAGISDFICRHLLDEGRLRDYALKVNIYRKLLDNAQPRAIVTDGLQNVVSNICMSLGRSRGIRSAVMWHGPYFDDMKMDVFGSDPRRPAVADMCLTWGRQQETYLEQINATVLPYRTGSPIAEAARRSSTEATTSGGRSRILLLQYSVTPYDTCWPHAQQYPLIAAAAKMLRDAYPDAEIRVKLHPGPPKVSYFERIFSHYGIDVRVCQNGPFTEHLNWSDIVIGPMHTGAMLEAMHAGKPFFPLLFTPTSIGRQYADALGTYGSIEALRDALRDDRPLSHAGFRRFVLSEGEIADPSHKVWEAMNALINTPAGEAA